MITDLSVYHRPVLQITVVNQRDCSHLQCDTGRMNTLTRLHHWAVSPHSTRLIPLSSAFCLTRPGAPWESTELNGEACGAMIALRRLNGGVSLSAGQQKQSEVSCSEAQS